ncbi:ribonuclease III [Brochothrix campestris]|uniref:Ribonuclease 3 n=1 Tax=Brochothrix campestris FSL F6-1037 TaxID=1265861 RepID=W7D1Q2_9LIST|nr:ribonuclease III [Brochothrix campestris]EUJ41856.1 ribonuclease III [Brochothrix campestris FSL F6-1037]
MKTLQALQEQVQITFKQEALLEQAFTHASYLNENRTKEGKHYERLEFLGDAVLELTVSDYLFNRYPERPEGQLTKLRAACVCEGALVIYANELQLSDYFRIGRGEENAGGRTREALIADIFEAFVGAMYLSEGIEVVREFLGKVVFPKIDQGMFEANNDYKTLLQEWLQQDGDIKIVYQLLAEDGPAHDKAFKVRLFVNDEPQTFGEGRTKKIAEQAAAQAALAAYQTKINN